MSKQEKYMMCNFPLAFQIDGASIVALLLVKNFWRESFSLIQNIQNRQFHLIIWFGFIISWWGALS